MTAERARTPAGVAAAAPTPHSPGGQVSIERLTLRIPGQNAAFGRRVVEKAVERVARSLPAGVRGQLPALQLNVRAHSSSEDGLSRAIADALLRAIERRGT